MAKLLDLPLELREQIYSYVVHPSPARGPECSECGTSYRYDLSLFRVNRQTYREALAVFRRENVFALLETPWQGTEQHIAIEGHVPVVATGPRASMYPYVQYHLGIRIEAPHHSTPDDNTFKLVLLMQDLPAFTRMWFYSNLTYPRLNNYLRLTLTLRNPYTSERTRTKTYAEVADMPAMAVGGRDKLPVKLQRQLLMPFGEVHNLDQVMFAGEPVDPGVEAGVREEMGRRPDSPEKCLAEAYKLKDEGNKAIKEGFYKDAIDCYEKSFLAVHIVCKGRRRSIWADAFFHTVLRGGEFHCQEGAIVRLVLRVKLVANIVLAYLKLEDYDEAYFWGMRSIRLMREAADGDDNEPMLDFVAAVEMGKIYYRTGVAAKHLGDESEARNLLRVAIQYLPNDATVRKEYGSVALKLG